MDVITVMNIMAVKSNDDLSTVLTVMLIEFRKALYSHLEKYQKVCRK